MKCPNCGAEIKEGTKVCDFCGSGITIDMQREQEQLKKRDVQAAAVRTYLLAEKNKVRLRGRRVQLLYERL